MQRLTWRWRLLAGIVVGVTWLLRWRVYVEGTEHLRPLGGAVLTFNHHSYLDFVAVAWPPVRKLGRPVRFLAKREMWSSRWLGWAVRWVGAVPVERGSASARAEAFDAAVAALRDGDLVVVAPEQTISESFELLPFRTGAARMAQRAGVPLVPVVGWGTHRCATKGHRPRVVARLPVVVRYGAPLPVGPDDDPAEATARLHALMTEMLWDVQGRYPDGAPAGAEWVPHRLGGAAPRHADVLRAHRQRAHGWRDGNGGGENASPPGQLP